MALVGTQVRQAEGSIRNVGLPWRDTLAAVRPSSSREKHWERDTLTFRGGDAA